MLPSRYLPHEIFTFTLDNPHPLLLLANGVVWPRLQVLHLRIRWLTDMRRVGGRTTNRTAPSFSGESDLFNGSPLPPPMTGGLLAWTETGPSRPTSDMGTGLEEAFGTEGTGVLPALELGRAVAQGLRSHVWHILHTHVTELWCK